MKIELDQVFSVTKRGNIQLLGASTRLGAIELRALVLLSKPMSLREIMPLIPESSEPGMLALAQALCKQGYIASSDRGTDDESIDFYSADMSLSPSLAEQQSATAQADKVKAELTRRGFYVSIARQAAQKVPPADGQSYFVLAIEDDPILARMYTQLLAMLHCRAGTASNRREVEEAVENGPKPDLIVLDLNLPDVGGFNLLHWLSAHPRLGSTPVIVASAETSKESIIRALALGADGYITKPIAVDSFTDSIRAVLGLPPIDRSKEGAWSGLV